MSNPKENDSWLQSVSPLPLGDTQVSTDPADRKAYSKDWTTAYETDTRLVFFPTTTLEVKKIVDWANLHKVALVPSGGRTGLSGGANATQQEVVISLDRMNKVLEFNEIDSLIRVQAGMVTEAVQQELEKRGYIFPVDFAAKGSSQIGGNLATNAGGIRVLRYGLTRDWVLGMTVVTGAGDVLSFNHGLVKNQTGYDFRHLFIGSEGTLGVITEVDIKFTSPPPPVDTVIVGAESIESVMEIFSKVKKTSTLHAFEFFNQNALRFVTSHISEPFPIATTCSYYCIFDYESQKEEDKFFEDLFATNGFLDAAVSANPSQAKHFWSFRERISESLASFGPYKNDISVRVSKVPACLNALDQTLAQHYPGWTSVWFGHIGDGNIHVNIIKPDSLSKPEFLARCREVDHHVFDLVEGLQGSVSAEHGVGLVKKDKLHKSRSQTEIEAMRRIKKIFDPNGILNPGKIFDP